MKRVAVIASVKNECDIIEFFCRYSLTCSDVLLIHENRKSSDNTREIIDKLIGEGLPIFFEAEGEDVYFEAAKRELVRVAVEKYDADLVIPLDADEFLCLAEGGGAGGAGAGGAGGDDEAGGAGNVDGDGGGDAGSTDNRGTNGGEISGNNKAGISPVRFVLENLREDVEYQIPWRTYVYEKEPSEPLRFDPGDFERYRSPALEEAQGHAGKAVASRFLLRERQAEFEWGAHWLNYPEGQMTEGEAPSGEELFGEEPLGKAPAGQEPSGQEHAGQVPSEQEPTGQEPEGKVPSGEMPNGEAPAEQATEGEAPAGQELAGKEPSGHQGHAAKIEVSKELVCAHYPIRSKQQVTRKAIINFINKWTLPEERRPTGEELAVYQLGIMFDDIKKNGEVSLQTMKEVSITYSLFSYKADKERVDGLLNGPGDGLLVKGALDTSVGTSFCADGLALKYMGVVEDDKAFLQAQLNLLDKALGNIDSESRGKAETIRELTHERNVLKNMCDGLTQERDMLKAHVEDMYQSVSWRIGSRIVGIYRFFVPGKNR